VLSTNMMMDKNSDNIQVMVRVRPFNGRERAEGAGSCVILDDYRPNCIVLDAKPDQKAFNFDWVGGERTTQQDIFEVVGKSMVHTCLEGYNCCIFAYGQTGAGKTFTMQGRGLEINDEDILNRGLQPRVFDYIFALKAKDMNENPDMKYLVTCSYLEIYNEQIMDLLEPVSASLQVREDLKKGVYVEGLKEEIVENSEETIELLRKGAINRHVGSTNMNLESSRSHSLFTMSIERKVVTNGTIHVRTSKFHFVDLAGSERQQKTAAVGERLKEAGNINKSLSVLGQVINSLVEIAEGKQRHIRYRDSKLTFILKDSLGGNSKTSLIANISPASSSFSETLSTLKFAATAKRIKNKASINEDMSGSVEGLKNEIRQLKEELARYKSNTMIVENESRRTLTPPRIPSHGHAGMLGFSLEHQRTLLEQNQRFVENEILLKQTLDCLTENGVLFQAELAKKEEYVNMFRTAVDFYSNNELQYRSVLSLNHVRIERLSQSLTIKSEAFDVNSLYHEEIDHLQKEVAYIFEIVKNTPAIMSVYMENVEMRERLDLLEAEVNPTSTISIARHLQENLILVHELNVKLDEDIRERRLLTEKLERLEDFRGGLFSPEKSRRSEEDIRKLKLEHNQQVEQMTQEIMNLKQRENEAHRILELESKKYAELLRENTLLKEENQNMEERYGKRYNELYEEIQQIHDIRSDPTTLESRIEQLNLKNFELKDQMLSFKDKNEKMMKLYQELEDHLQTTLREKDENETDLREQLDKAVAEKNILETSVSSLENNFKIISEDLEKYERENKDLSQTLSDFYIKENEYKINAETLYQENVQLQEKLSQIEDLKNAEIRQLEAIVEKQKIFLETLENDRTKVQEELDTLTQTLNYNVNQLEEKKQLLAETQEKLSEKEKTFEEVEGEFNRQKEYTLSLEKQIQDFNHETSPFNLALKENARLHEEVKMTLAQVKSLEEELQGKKDELEQAQTRIAELSESAENYSSAYKDVFAKFEVKVHEAKELQTALDSKIAELAQLEQELKASNENTLNKESEIIDLKTQILKLTDNTQELENKNIQLIAEIEEKKVENGQLTQKREELQNSIHALEQQVEQMKLAHFNELEQLTSSLMALEVTSNQKSLEIKDLEAKLQEASQNIQDLRTQNGQMEEENQGLKDALQKMKEEVEIHFQKLNDIIVTRDEECKQLLEEKQTALNEIISLKEDIVQRTEEFNKLQGEKDNALNEISVLKEDIVKRTEEYRLIEEEKTTALNEIVLLKEDIVKRTEEYRLIEEEKTTALNEIVLLKEEINKRIEEFNQLEEEKNKALNEISLQKEEITKRIEDFNQLQGEKEKALNEISLQKEEITKKIEQVNQLEGEKNTALNEIASLKDEVTKRDELLKENDSMLLMGAQEITKLQNTLLQTEEELQNYKNAQEQSLNKISELEQELATKEELQRSNERKIEENNSRIEELQNAMNKLEGELEGSRKQVTEALEKISELSNEINTLQESLKLKEENIQENLRQLENLQNQVSKTQQDLEVKTSMLHETEQRLAEKTLEMTNQITHLEAQIVEKNSQIETLEKSNYLSEDTIRDLKNKIEDYSLKVAELGERLVSKDEEMKSELEKKAKEYNAEIEVSRKQVADLQTELEELKALIQTDYVTLKEYNGLVAEMQNVLDEEKNGFAAQLNSIQEEINKDAKEREEMMVTYENKEKELNAKIARFTEEAAEYERKVQEFQEKNENLDMDNQKKAAEIQECLEGMTRMKETLDSYQESLRQFEELKGVRQENNELKLSHKKQEEMINHLHKSFSEYYRSQEVEMARLKESYNKLQEESEFIKANIEQKEAEILLGNERTRIALQEKDNLLIEMKRLKDNESSLKKAKEEAEEKMTAINNEKIAMMNHLNEVEKINSQLIGHNNPNQKRQYVNDLKDEIKKHQNEKNTVQTNLNKALAKNQQLQKQIDDFAKRHNIDSTKLGSDLNNDPDVLIELNRLKIENHNMKDIIFRINTLLNEAFIHLKSLPQHTNASKEDMSMTVEHTRELVRLIKTKEKTKAEKERELDFRHFDIQLIDKSLEDFKQNYNATLSDTAFKAVIAPPMVSKKNIENKENTHDQVVEKPKSKEMNLSKVLAPRALTGVKRNITTMMSNPVNKGTSFVDRFGRKQVSDISRVRKESSEKTKATRPSYDKPSSKKKEALMKSGSIGDITNRNSEDFGVTKKIKQ